MNDETTIIVETVSDEKKKKIIKQLYKAVEAYKKHLVGHTFMFVYDNKYFELTFGVRNFQHLTGICSKLSSKEFYQKCNKHQIRFDDIYFTNEHTSANAEKKLQSLPYLYQLVNKQCYILEEITTDTRIYKLGMANFDYTLLLEENDLSTHVNIPVSFRINSFLAKSKRPYKCEFVFHRTSDKVPYNEYSYSLYPKTQVVNELNSCDEIIKRKIDIEKLKNVQI